MILKVFLFLGFAATGFASPVPFDFERISPFVEEETNDFTDATYRLERIAQPDRYVIELSPYIKTGDAKEFTFDGTVTLEFTTLKDSNTLVLHSKDLTFTSIKFTDKNEQIKYKFDEERHFLILESLDLKNGEKNTIEFKYKGIIQYDMHGFYSSYYMENGTRKWLLSTQFQPTHARKAFPCFDEPSYKAVFKLTINSPDINYHCISNTKITNKIGLKYEFDETPKMSTYLLAFIVSEFEMAKTGGGDYGNFGVWARPEARDQGEFTYKEGKNILDAMIEFTQIEYYDKNTKIDQAAIPDFAAGAMENWGLLTYREALLMVDPKESSSRMKQQVAAILAHEIAHQWFGDLVTCHWWSDTWLNEGFATYFQYFITNKVAPEFRLDHQFMVMKLQNAMLADTSNSSAALTNEVNSPTEVSRHFGAISYDKGASILRMIEHWLGSGTFQKGIQKYLHKKQFENAVPEDLYEGLQLAAEEDNSIEKGTTVESVMKSWVINAGYPVLKVIIDHETGNLNLTQKRFVKQTESSDTLYNIPITYTTESETNFDDTKPKIIMTKDQLEVEGDEQHGWVVFNIQQTGYYRVLYDRDLYNSLIKVLSSKNRTHIHEYNRGQIVDDAFNFAREGLISYDFMLNITQFLENELDYNPWASAYTGFNFMRTRFFNIKGVAEKLDHHILTLMQKLIEHLGFEVRHNDDDFTKIFRMNTMNLACDLEHEGCVEKSKNLFTNMNKNGIHPDLREFAYCTALKYGNESVYDELWDKYENENVIGEKLVILNTLGCTNMTSKLHEFLNSTLDPTPAIRMQDRMTAFNAALMNNRANLMTIYDFVMNNVKVIRHAYGENNLHSILASVGSRMNKDQLSKFEADLDTNKDLTVDEKAAGKTVATNAKKVLDWAEKRTPEIMDWLDAKYNSANNIGLSFSLLFAMLIFLFFSR